MKRVLIVALLFASGAAVAEERTVRVTSFNSHGRHTDYYVNGDHQGRVYTPSRPVPVLPPVIYVAPSPSSSCYRCVIIYR